MRGIPYLHRSLIFHLIFLVGLVLLVTICTWAYFNIQYQKDNAIQNIVGEIDRLGNTIKLGTHYAMMLNAKDDINQIINNISRQEEIKNVRIYNKGGKIIFSNVKEEVDQITNIKADACYICHRLEPALDTVSLAERTRIFDSGKGYRLLGIISPIYNEPSCSADACHYHPADKKVFGALDVVVSLEKTDLQVLTYKQGLIAMAAVSACGTILLEAGLSYLGLGVPVPAPSWGRMIGDSLSYFRIAPWLVVFPGLAIVYAALAFNLIGNGLTRDAGGAGS